MGLFSGWKERQRRKFMDQAEPHRLATTEVWEREIADSVNKNFTGASPRSPISSWGEPAQVALRIGSGSSKPR